MGQPPGELDGSPEPGVVTRAAEPDPEDLAPNAAAPDPVAARGDQPAVAGSRVDAGTKTESGPLGRIDPKDPKAGGTVVARPPARVVSTLVVAGFVGLIGCLFLLGTIADGVRDQEVFILDAWATPFLHSIATPALDAVMTGLTTMGSAVVLVPIFIAVVIGLIARRRYGAALFFTIASGGALVIDATMKLIFQRPRPKLDYASVLPDYSFPSGHSMNGVVFYVGLALIAWSIFGRRVGLASVVAAALLALGIGTSRIYLGYHYFTDVLGGFLAGVAWLLIVGAAFRARPKLWEWRTAQPEPTAATAPTRAAAQPAAPGPDDPGGRDPAARHRRPESPSRGSSA
jgi:membrane-associated phospholipid phosphatase